MANGKPGYSSQKPALPGGRAMYEMPVFDAPGRNRLGQTPAQAAAAKKAVAANLLLPEERRYMRPDLGESPTMRSERLEGERMGRERGTTVASRRRTTQARGARPQSANMRRFLAAKQQRERQSARQVQRRRTDDQFM